MNNSLAHFDELRFHLSDEQKSQLSSYSKGPTVIDNNVILSRNVCILSGVKIGDGAVLAAGAVITKDVPPFAIVGGNPAKVIKYRFPDAVIESLLEIRWWDFEYVFLCRQLGFILSASTEAFLERYSDCVNNVYEKGGDYLLLRTGLDPSGEQTIVVDGVESEGQRYGAQELPPEILAYLSQDNPKNVTIDHDIMRFLPTEARDQAR